MTASQPPETPAQPGEEARPEAQAPAGGPGPAPAPVAKLPAPTLEEQLAAARKEAAGHYDHYLRAVADLENYRRRVAREKDEMRQYAAANLLQHLLPLLDNLQLALAAARQDAAAKSIADGVAMVLDQFKGVLERHGVKELNPLGQKFDAHLHESLSHQPSAEVPEEHVLQVVRAGYSLHGRLLRPASVVLSSGPAKEAKG
jgi:molecular chaperone GrpE